MAHLGPADGAIPEWDQSIDVTVPGAPIAVSDFTLIDAAAGQTFRYQQSIPVEWTLVAGAPTVLTLEVVTEKGEVAATETLSGLQYVGHGKAWVSLNSPTYDAVVRPDMVPVHLRATARIGSQEIVRAGQRFILSAEYEMTSDTAPHVEVERETRAATLTQTLWNPSCDGYLIDWGDGATPERKVAPAAPQQGCILAGVTVTSRHVYPQPGRYRIVLRTSSFSYQDAPEDAPSYQAFDVTVP
jgi:hypothetical protein